MGRFTGSASKTLEATDEQKQKVADIEAWKNQGTDEYYMNLIEKYKGTEWYDELVNNPWLRANNAPYSRNFLQDITYGLFEDTSAEDEYYGNLQNARNQYLAETLEKIRQQEHDKPEAEVARRRSAGLNDDLNGGQAIGTGEAAENDQPMQAPPGMGGQGNTARDIVMGAFDAVQKAYSFTMGFMQDKEALKAAKIANEEKDVDVLDKVMNTTQKLAGFSFRNPGNDEWNSINPFDVQKALPGKRYKKFNWGYGIAYSNMETYRKSMEGMAGIVDDKVKYEKSQGIKDAYGLWEIGNTTLRDFTADLAKTGMDMQKIEQQGALQHTKGVLKYEQNKDYGLAARAENKEYQAAIKRHEMNKVFNGFMSDWSKRLEEQSKEPGMEGVFATALLGFLSLQSMNMMPNISISPIKF